MQATTEALISCSCKVIRIFVTLATSRIAGETDPQNLAKSMTPPPLVDRQEEETTQRDSTLAHSPRGNII